MYGQLETLASLGEDFGVIYPSEVIDRGWEILLLNQFHDIIPGSAIHEVYEQSDIEFAEILTNGAKKIEDITKQITAKLDANTGDIVVYNTLGYERDDIVRLTLENTSKIVSVKDKSGKHHDIQVIDDKTIEFFATQIPSLGYKIYQIVEGENKSVSKEKWNYTFENKFYKICFNKKMEITSLIERENEREVLKEGRVGNELIAYEDRPMNWDNWDIDAFYKKKPYEADDISEPKIIENGSLKTVIETQYTFVDSIITQQAIMYKDIPRIDFKNYVTWNNHNTLLKVNFPVEINTTRATCEIQYGNTERETTSNHSWDTAKFETCAHKWVDLSENGIGVSMLNDCKYGHSIKDGEMGLTLIKAGIYPDEQADIGEHEFTYSIYPHAGRWQEADTVEMAYNLNVPLIVDVKAEEKEVQKYENIETDKKNCFIEVLKKAEDGNGHILRLYENQNKMVKVELKVSNKYLNAHGCDLLERNNETLAIENNIIKFKLKPYEIKTIRLTK